jgi:hypothetical protein
MAFPVVVDACALYPYSLRDTLLRLAEAEFYEIYWSEGILAEMTRCLVEIHGASDEQAAKVRKKTIETLTGQSFRLPKSMS